MCASYVKFRPVLIHGGMLIKTWGNFLWVGFKEIILLFSSLYFPVILELNTYTRDVYKD